MKQIFKKLDKPLLFITVLYSILGLLLVLSSSSVIAVMNYEESPYYFFIRQFAFVFVGYLIGFLFILRFPIRRYKKFLPILLIGLVLVLVFLLLYGEFTNSARSWLNIAGFGIQPSEFAKLILILFMAFFYGNYNQKTRGKYEFFIPIAYSIFVVALILLQPDLGTATIVAGIVMLTFMAIPLSGNNVIKTLKILAGVAIIAVVVFLSTGESFLTEEQQSRLNFKDPCQRYTEKTGYQVCNGFIAINSGGLIGKGLGNSTQKYLYLPEAYTDFIFPIAVEELGVIICSIIILGFLFMIFRIIYIAKKATNLRNSIICYGVSIYLLLHLLINFLGILALIPLTGVPVPFFSYGGSFAICVILAMFLVQRVVIESKNDRMKRDIDNF